MSAAQPLSAKNRQLMQRNGFTLVELLVALFIFGLISSAAVMLLRSASDSQLQLKNKLSMQGNITRLSNLLEADLAQAVARPSRNANGSKMAAFLTQDRPGSLFAFSRTGLGMGGDDADGFASSIGRVEYELVNRQFIRKSTLYIDGGQSNPPAILLDDVDQILVKYRDQKGQWRDDWNVDDNMQMPRAIEVNIMQKNIAPLQLILIVGSQSRNIPMAETENSTEENSTEENSTEENVNES
ncbi:type II secretion system protein GspJ [Sphingorhabdus lutea]|uniref:Type II secretion system protein J n=1 Tax=Sphingorhabdus lutea TaxID=1913578 RepID=A0A1L3JA29_9SPHN|nr:type II secretion system minor pseudopilin GspJ [Sphingorhabdus lutea]APG61981.1 type II secretion system protein GspJ [Sphingorhabdus lutea]